MMWTRETDMKSPFAVRLEDALSWHDTSKEVAGKAERSGFRVRAYNRRWQVWATAADLAAISRQ
jgi:hypothetical protein